MTRRGRPPRKRADLGDDLKLKAVRGKREKAKVTWTIPATKEGVPLDQLEQVDPDQDPEG